MSRFDKLLLTELRVLQSHEDIDNSKASKGDLSLALADSENLKAIGYQLTYEGIVKLARDYYVNPKMTPLYKRVMDLEPSIEASPMYPNFPRQVLEMDELEFRTHQLLHYLTTYGLEELLDIEVKEGWLPETTNVAERLEDAQVAELKTLDYLSAEEVDQKVIDGLIGRKERLESKEVELSKEVMLRTNLLIENVPFKENIGLIYGELLLNGTLEERYKSFDTLTNIVKHPGDVLDLTEQLVVLNKYKHFKTSVKRGLVDLIEQFSDGAIEENFASNRWSNKFLGKGGKPRSINRNIALIDYLSYSRFSKNSKAEELVGELKSGKLLSWNQRLEQHYKEERYDEVLNLLVQRPGVLFRQVNRLVSLGVPNNKISMALKRSAGDLKTQTIVSALNNFEGDKTVDKIFLDTLISNFLTKDIKEFNGKKVYIDEDNVDFSRSKIEITDKFAEGGYISNGMAIRIPDDAEFIRFFTYWNDERRIDIDLHGVSADKAGNHSHVGWHGNFKDASLVHSGDITHSDATEYIDLNLALARENDISKVQFNINSYTGVPFSEIDTVFTGLMALSEMGEEVKLYDSKNVIFRHDLEYNSMAIDYGMIDIENNVIYVGGKPSDRYNDENIFDTPNHKLTIKNYLGLLILTQGGELVWTRDEADLVVGLAKSDEENYVSLIDNNFFM